MSIAFPWPISTGEWLAWAAAMATLVFGLGMVIAPGRLLGILRKDPLAGSAGGLSVARAQIGGFYAGMGLAAILFAQPLIYMTLGFAWALASLGWLISLVIDAGDPWRQWIGLAASLLLASLSLGFVFGFVA